MSWLLLRLFYFAEGKGQIWNRELTCQGSFFFFFQLENEAWLLSFSAPSSLFTVAIPWRPRDSTCWGCCKNTQTGLSKTDAEPAYIFAFCGCSASLSLFDCKSSLGLVTVARKLLSWFVDSYCLPVEDFTLHFSLSLYYSSLLHT